VDTLAASGGRPFTVRFPEPPGLQQHRDEMERLLKERDRLPGVEVK